MIDQQKAKEAYEAFVGRAREDERIIGVILSGGRGKGVETENSDYDVMLITTDEAFDAVKKDYPKTEFIDSIPHAISPFRDYTKAGTGTEYDKYNFTHNKALIDKTGEIEKLVEAKGALELDEARKITRDALDGYLNSLYRSLKNFRDKNDLAGRLDAGETISWLLTFIFALEGRVRPFNKFLAWELANYPLVKLPLAPKDFLQKIEIIAGQGEIETQKEVLALVRQLATDNGYVDELSGWDGYYFGDSL